MTSPEQVLALMEQGVTRRHTGETNMNAASSRSHTIFRMVGCRTNTPKRAFIIAPIHPNRLSSLAKQPESADSQYTNTPKQTSICG